MLGNLPKQNNPNIVVGYENSDDAGIFRLETSHLHHHFHGDKTATANLKTASKNSDDSILLVQTLDFFTPVADDPHDFGVIAAVNSLNDIYAMGGTPITALSIVCYPQKGDLTILGDILKGGHETMIAENVAVLGGHSIDDPEIKIGYSVTGIVDNKRLTTNANARPGDLLVLTKPLGTGVISTGLKFEKASKNAAEAAIKYMTKSAREASNLMSLLGANACTDITGFGLLGHAFEMATASEVRMRIDSTKVPLMPDVIDLIEQKMLTRGDRNNRAYVGESVRIAETVDGKMQSALFDPQTAGGLLISMRPDKAREFLDKADEAWLIGEIVDKIGDQKREEVEKEREKEREREEGIQTSDIRIQAQAQVQTKKTGLVEVV
ncbi:MAG: selenide, water dikinase SelD [Pyrinomonadaceae bacterium]